MPENGRQPEYSLVRERYWRNRAHNELEARRNGATAQGQRSTDPIRVLSKDELKNLRDKYTRVPRNPVSGRAMELEHSGVQQRVEIWLRELGFSRDEAILLSGSNDPKMLMELTP